MARPLPDLLRRLAHTVGRSLLERARTQAGTRTGTDRRTAPADVPVLRRDPTRGRVATSQARAEVAYAPVRDGDADPGEVVWTWVPYEDDPARGKDRPVLVVGRLGADVAALALTSRPHDDRHHHPLGVWDAADGRPSWVRLDRVLRLDPDGIRREGATLDRARFDATVAAWESY